MTITAISEQDYNLPFKYLLIFEPIVRFKIKFTANGRNDDVTMLSLYLLLIVFSAN